MKNGGYKVGDFVTYEGDGEVYRIFKIHRSPHLQYDLVAINNEAISRTADADLVTGWPKDDSGKRP